MSPYEKAREVFNSYAASDNAAGLRPEQALQLRLYQWQVHNFGSQPAHNQALGICEEVGETAEAMLGMSAGSGKIAHAVLKEDQHIRGMDHETARTEVADGIADVAIFSIQLCTAYRLDYWTLVQATAEEVMQRTWKDNPVDGGADE